jgi:hypothetical protein
LYFPDTAGQTIRHCVICSVWLNADSAGIAKPTRANQLAAKSYSRDVEGRNPDDFCLDHTIHWSGSRCVLMIGVAGES